MTIRLKVIRRQQEQARKVKELMMFTIKVPRYSNSYYQYQPIGASNTSVIDPKIEKTRNLFEMFGLHLAR